MGPKLLLTKHSRTPFPCTENLRRKGSGAAAPKGMATVTLAPLWFKLLASDDYKQIVVYRGKTLVPMCNLPRVASAEGPAPRPMGTAALLRPPVAAPLGLAPPARGGHFDLKFFCSTFGKRMAVSLPWHSLLSQEQAVTGLVQKRLCCLPCSAVSQEPLMQSAPSKLPRRDFRTDNGLLKFLKSGKLP